MAEAKDIRSWIVTLIILLIGLWILLTVGKSFIAGASSSLTDNKLLPAIDSMSLSLSIGIGIVIILLVPLYLSKRSSGNKKPLENV